MKHIGDDKVQENDRWARKITDSQVQVDLITEDCNIKLFYPFAPQHNAIYFQNTAYAVSIMHMPTGIKVMCSQSKDKDVNTKIALKTLYNKLNMIANSGDAKDRLSLKTTVYKRKDEQVVDQMVAKQSKPEVK